LTDILFSDWKWYNKRKSFRGGFSMGKMKQIAKKVEKGSLFFTKHAYEQMIARDIYIKQVHEAILNGKVVQKWRERDGEKMAIVGKRFNGDPIKVVVKNSEPLTVITVCYPY